MCQTPFSTYCYQWSPALATWGTPSRHGQKAALWYRHLARRIPGELLVNYYG
jgi:hypothetical protein